MKCYRSNNGILKDLVGVYLSLSADLYLQVVTSSPISILKNLVFTSLKQPFTVYWSSMGMHRRNFESTVVIRSTVIIQGCHEPYYPSLQTSRKSCLLLSYLCEQSDHTMAWAFFSSTAQPHLSCHQGAKRPRQHDTGLCKSPKVYALES